MTRILGFGCITGSREETEVRDIDGQGKENAQKTDSSLPSILSLPTRIGTKKRDRHAKMVSVIPRIFEETETGVLIRLNQDLQDSRIRRMWNVR